MGNQDETFIKKALKDCKYSYPDVTRRECLEIILHWRGLKPIVTDFVFGNGERKNLIALQGTIPMRYRGATYHIPVEIFLLDTHPHSAPLVYVRPTPNMRIKASKHVDNSGKVYHPFLHSWKPDSGLMQLIQVLILTFEEQPPVYAVPAQPFAQAMPPPQPLGPTAMSGSPYPLQQSPYATPYPPYPGSMQGASMPMPNMPHPPLLPQASSDTLTVHIRASLISAVREKLQRRLEDIYLSTQIEMKTGDELKEGTTKLEGMIKGIDMEKASLHKTIGELGTTAEELQEKISRENKEDAEALVDDAIQAPAPLYKQIVNAFAEEAAIEDTIYYLSERFRNGKLDLEQFQKHLRILARKQFMLRATLRKCRQKAGLAG